MPLLYNKLIINWEKKNQFLRITEASKLGGVCTGALLPTRKASDA